MKRQSLLVMLLGLLSLHAPARGDDPATLTPGQRPLVATPLSFDVDPAHRLYLLGRRIQHVTLEIDSMGILSLNGTIIFPSHRVDRPHSPEVWERDADYLQSLYGAVPFVQGEVAAGRTWGEAVRLYFTLIRAVIDSLTRVYNAAASSMSHDEAMASAASQVLERDSLQLVDSLRCGNRSFHLKYKGLPGWIYTPDLLRRQGAHDSIPSPESRRRAPVKRARHYAMRLFDHLSRVSIVPCFMTIGYGGDHWFGGNKDVARAIAQVDRVLSGEDPVTVSADGPLTRSDLFMIVAAHEEGVQ